MWVVYNKTDKQVVGMSAAAELDLEKKEALKEVVRGLAKPGALKSYDAVQVEGLEAARALMDGEAMGGSVVVKGRRGKLRALVEAPEAAMLLARTTAKQFHPADGVPLVPADGKSFTTIIVEKTSEEGTRLGRVKDNDRLWLRTDHGTLRDGTGKRQIRSLKLAKGRASFRLYSGAEKRLATVRIFNQDENLMDGGVSVEFV